MYMLHGIAEMLFSFVHLPSPGLEDQILNGIAYTDTARLALRGLPVPAL